MKHPDGFNEIVDRLEKMLQIEYGNIYVGSGYGLYNYPGPEKGWFLHIQTDDKSIRDQLPKEFEGYPVIVSGIAKAC